MLSDTSLTRGVGASPRAFAWSQAMRILAVVYALVQVHPRWPCQVHVAKRHSRRRELLRSSIWSPRFSYHRARRQKRAFWRRHDVEIKRLLGGLIAGLLLAPPVAVATWSPAALAATEPTGSSPSGQLTVSIEQPVPGTLVRHKTPLKLSGTVTSAPTPVNFIYVVDVSSGTLAGSACADRNGDGSSTILDCEIAGLVALNEANLSVDADVSLISFASTAQVHDLDPRAAGFQTTTGPNTDADLDGTPDVVQALRALQSVGAAASYDDALLATQALLVQGETNRVFFVSDGQSVGDAGPTTGPGSPLQALSDAGAIISTYAVNPTPGGCSAGEPLQTIASSGGDCVEITDPEQMRVSVTSEPVLAVDRVEVEVKGSITVATLDATSGQFALLIPARMLDRGRNDIIVRAYGSGRLEGEVAEAQTWVDVRRGRGEAGPSPHPLT